MSPNHSPSISDGLVQTIRTLVPIGVGSLVAWLVTVGIVLDPGTETAIVTGVTGLTIAAYWALVSLIAKRFPAAGWLLGYPSKPTYGDAPKEIDTFDPAQRSADLDALLAASSEFDDDNAAIFRAED